MITWEELTKLDLGCPTKQFARNECVEIAYANHKKNLSRMQMTPEQYIESIILRGQTRELSVNAFPYAVARNIMHLLYWFGRDEERIPMAVVKDLVASRLGVSPADVVCFENPAELRSIPGIAHYHVFVKK